MKKTLHILAIIAMGAVIIGMTGCASLKGIPLDEAVLSGKWDEREAQKIGPITVWTPKLAGETVTFGPGNKVTIHDPLLGDQEGVYRITGYVPIAEGTVVECAVKGTSGLMGAIDAAGNSAMNALFGEDSGATYYGYIVESKSKMLWKIDTYNPKHKGGEGKVLVGEQKFKKVGEK
jgi:hypothetical protein